MPAVSRAIASCAMDLSALMLLETQSRNSVFPPIALVAALTASNARAPREAKSEATVNPMASVMSFMSVAFCPI